MFEHYVLYTVSSMNASVLLKVCTAVRYPTMSTTAVRPNHHSAPGNPRILAAFLVRISDAKDQAC